jgi:adenine deaminase
LFSFHFDIFARKAVSTITVSRSRTSLNTSFDLILRGGRVIDPAQSLEGVHDVAVKDGRIAAMRPSIAPSSAKESVDVSGKLVLLVALKHAVAQLFT